MGYGISLILMAAGAILVWAVNATASGVNIHTVGWILMAVGFVGFLLTVAFWTDWNNSQRQGSRRKLTREDYFPPDDL